MQTRESLKSNSSGTDESQPLLAHASNRSKVPSLPLLTVAHAEPRADSRAPVYAAGGLWQQHRVSILVLYFAALSGPLLVINKLTVHHLPAPTFNLLFQVAFAAAVVRLAGFAGLLESAPLRWETVRKYAGVVAGFAGVLMANMKVLQYANVETFIVFRSSTPLIISLLDYVYLGRELPSCRSWACLIALTLGSVGYVISDHGFRLRAYIWVVVWYCFFLFDAIYIKYVCDTVEMSAWGRVYYTNLLATIPLAIGMPLTGDLSYVLGNTWRHPQIGWLLVSSCCGLAMSHASFCLRSATSATTFTVAGTCCKLLTVLINYLIWDQHANAWGMLFLFVCLAAGSLYEQAPARREAQAGVQAGPPEDEEKQAILKHDSSSNITK